MHSWQVIFALGEQLESNNCGQLQYISEVWRVGLKWTLSKSAEGPCGLIMQTPYKRVCQGGEAWTSASNISCLNRCQMHVQSAPVHRSTLVTIIENTCIDWSGQNCAATMCLHTFFFQQALITAAFMWCWDYGFTTNSHASHINKKHQGSTLNG